MLGPDQRELFLGALSPPDGYRFDRGIGTTFTLDLLTVLIAPLSLAFLEVREATAALGDPVLLLEGLRRHAEHLTIFCQVGRIAIPPPDSYLLSFLEDRIVQVRAPRGGVFHPKLWLLRYKAEDRDMPPLYRILSLSRNLTFDNSWDLMLRLEGLVATNRMRAYGRNNPLGDFVRCLPSLAVYDEDRQQIIKGIDLLQDEVRRVDFRVPLPFNQKHLAFYPSGIPGYPRGYRFDQHASRVMIVSPFLSDHLLQQATAHGKDHILVSRADSLAALKAQTLERFNKSYVLDDMRYSFEQEEGDGHLDTGEEITGVKPEPSGLHAKLFILESGWDATWLVGSANATNAAFDRKNVEFMVGLQGRRSKVGIDQILGQEGNDTLASLLKIYTPPESDVAIDKSAQKAEELANRVRNWLVALDTQLTVRQHDPDRFDLLLRAERADEEAPGGIYCIACWPVTLHTESRVAFTLASLDKEVAFANLSLLALTPFIAFEVEAQVKGSKHTLRFVLKIPISGMPAGRMDHVFGAIISDRSQFLRYLWLILAQEDPSQWMDWMEDGTGDTWKTAFSAQERPVLEAMLRALSRSPDKIDRIAEMVESLRCMSKGQSIFPEGFELLWDALLQVRGGMA